VDSLVLAPAGKNDQEISLTHGEIERLCLVYGCFVGGGRFVHRLAGSYGIGQSLRHVIGDTTCGWSLVVLSPAMRPERLCRRCWR
jgi:hypothetical protein